MDNENFYIHLTNSIKPASPQEIDNNIGNFITRLNRKVELSDDWEVGLTDICYTKSWYNIIENQKIIIVEENKPKPVEFPCDTELLAGYYKSPDDIVNTINEILEDFKKYNPPLNIEIIPKLFYDKNTNKIKVGLGQKDGRKLYLNFSDYLGKYLGLTDSQERQYPLVVPYKEVSKGHVDVVIVNASTKSPAKTTQSAAKATQPDPKKQKVDTKKQNTVQSALKKSKEDVYDKLPDPTPNELTTIKAGVIHNQNDEPQSDEPTINPILDKHNSFVDAFKQVILQGTINSLYVYCDLIKPSLVGNYESQLIRRVEIPNDKNFGDNCEINYSQPQYYPLVSHEFNSIEIDIKDDTDKTIEFGFGKTGITLHFRKKNQNVFQSLHQLLR